MAVVRFAGTLAAVVDILLTLAAGSAVVRRRGLLPVVVLLLAADPLWSFGLHAAAPRVALHATPALRVVAAVLSGAPLWAAFILGLAHVLGPEPRSARSPARVPDR